MNGRPATAFSSCAAPSGNAQTSPVARGLLTRLQLVDDVVDPLLHAGVAGGRVHQRRGAEIVTERVTVAADAHPRLLGLPAAVDRRLRLEARVDAEVVQQPIGLQREQIGEVALLRVEERAVEQAHVVERERRRPRGERRGAYGWRRPCRPALPATRASSCPHRQRLSSVNTTMACAGTRR